MPQPTNDSGAIARSQDVATLAVEAFAPYVGQTFDAIAAGDVVVPLVLESAVAKPEFTLQNAARTSFSLIFTGPLEGPFLDGMGGYILRHPEAGTFPPLLISRVTPDPTGKPAAYYQLVCT